MYTVEAQLGISKEVEINTDEKKIKKKKNRKKNKDTYASSFGPNCPPPYHQGVAMFKDGWARWTNSSRKNVDLAGYEVEDRVSAFSN